MIKNSIIILLVMLFAAPAFAASQNDKRGQFTSAVKEREPVDNITQIETSYKTLTFFSEIVNCVGCKLKHEWWFAGRLVSEVDATIKYSRHRWWSKLSVSGTRIPGTWTVKVLLNGSIVRTANIEYFEPTQQQQNEQSIQKKLQIKDANECETNLTYFRGKAIEHPDDPFFKFKYDKWAERCFVSE